MKKWNTISSIAVCSLAAFAVAACSGAQRNESRSIRPTPSVEELNESSDVSLLERVVSDVIPEANAAFEVVFQWTEADSRFVLGPGIVVWRQHDGIVRWDEAHQGVNNPLTGVFVIRKDGDSEPSLPCVWDRVVPATVLTRVDCTIAEFAAFDPGPFPAMDFALTATLTDVLRRKMIGERVADCYGLDGGGTVCLDSETRIPLYLHVTNLYTGMNQTITADDVSATSGDKLTIDPSPAPGDDVDPQVLSIPDVFELRPFKDPRE